MNMLFNLLTLAAPYIFIARTKAMQAYEMLKPYKPDMWGPLVLVSGARAGLVPAAVARLSRPRLARATTHASDRVAHASRDCSDAPFFSAICACARRASS